MEKIMPVFGQRLKLLRKEKHMTQKEMAGFLGCTERNYQKMEYGDINVPSLTLIRLADFFQVSPDYLAGRGDRAAISQADSAADIQMPAFGRRLKSLRKERKLTQKAMAELLGKTERHYQDMEAGKINVPGLTLIKLADFFQVSLDCLLGRCGPS